MFWKNKFINFNKYSRPTTKLQAVRKLVLHYTANNGASANGHYNYFNNLSGVYASAHLFVDRLEALCIIPLDEIAYHANDRIYRGVQALKPNANFLSIGVEMCLEKDGSFHPDMIERTENVMAELCRMYDLNPLEDIVRHYDVTGKNCPAPWVANGSLFTAFKSRVNEKMANPAKVVIDTTPLLHNGDTGSYVKEAQQLLVKKGFKLDADGVFGDGTEEAVREFQADSKLEADGYIGDATWKALRSVVAPVSNPVVKPVAKPVAKPVVEKAVIKPKAKAIGKAVILVDVLNIRKSSDFDSALVGKCVKNAKFDVYEVKNGLLKIDENKWISAGSEYVKYTPNTAPKPKESALTLKYSGYLNKGDKGANVKALQKALNHLKFNVGEVDGVYGAGTFDAVKRFQMVYLAKEVDGIAGQGTMKKINSLLN